MLNLFLLKVAVLATALSYFASAHPVPVNVPDAWNFACAVNKVQCAEINPPTVVIDTAGEGPCQGLTWGGYTPYFPNEVHICVDSLFYADPVYVQSVVVHEMTHYLDVMANPDIPGCDTEYNAHYAGNQYLITHGHPEWAEYDWPEWYGCAAPKETP